MNQATTDDGTSPLCISSQEGHKDIVQMLLGHKANVNEARTNTGFCPLHAASSRGNQDEVQLLLAAGADQNLLNLVSV